MKTKHTITKICAVCAAVFFSAQLVNAQEEKPKEEFKPSGKVWGYAFGDFFYKAASDTMVRWGDAEYARNKKEDFRFTFRRIYLGLDYNISPKLSTKLLLENNDAPVTGDGRRTVYIKQMFLEWKDVIPRGKILLGLHSTPSWSPVAEKVWGYRQVEKTIMDFRKLGSAVDMGVSLIGAIDSAGVFEYWFMLATGTSTKPEDNSLKKTSGALTVKLLNKKLVINLYGDYEDISRMNGLKSNISFKGFIGYESSLITAGIEVPYIMRKDAKRNTATATADTTDVTPFGFTVFVKGPIIKDKLYAFARYDNYNNDQNYKTGDVMISSTNPMNAYSEQFIIAGLDIAPHKNFRIIPNIWVNMYKDKREKMAPTDPGYNGYYERKADVVPRITFFYTFK